MIEYFVRLVQVHTSFRRAELEALALLAGIDVQIFEYRDESPICILGLPSDAAAKAFISRSMLSMAIYELWGQGREYAALHSDIRTRTSQRWQDYKDVSFRFTVDSFQGKRSNTAQRRLIESFSYLGFGGPIIMTGADEEFTIFELYEDPEGKILKDAEPSRLFFGRLVGKSARDIINKYDLKKRKYISTTSMDAELALVTANLTLASPGKLFFDPFAGTGGFPVACSHFGAMAMGADIDGRSIRGKKGRNVVANFSQYGLLSRYIDGFIADLTNSPLRGSAGESKVAWLDGIVCDPPYGVREGLKVLGRKDGEGKEPVWIDGAWAHLREGFVPPKKPYSFEALMDDILEFAAVMLVENGRLGMWMPTANDEDIELAIPTHNWLELVSVCVQPFNKWSRRLLVYRRRCEGEIDITLEKKQRQYGTGKNADELNRFRKKFFEGFKEQQIGSDSNKDKGG